MMVAAAPAQVNASAKGTVLPPDPLASLLRLAQTAINEVVSIARFSQVCPGVHSRESGPAKSSRYTEPYSKTQPAQTAMAKRGSQAHFLTAAAMISASIMLGNRISNRRSWSSRGGQCG